MEPSQNDESVLHQVSGSTGLEDSYSEVAARWTFLTCREKNLSDGLG